MSKANIIQAFLHEHMVPVDFISNEEFDILGVVFDEDFVLWIDLRGKEGPNIFWAQNKQEELN